MDLDVLDTAAARRIYAVKDERGRVAVYENDEYRWMCIASPHPHSAMDLAQPWRPVLPYYSVLLSSLLFQAAPASVLMLGLGGGDLVRYYRHYLPDSRLQVVELNALVMDTYRQYFRSSETEDTALDIHQADVCEYLHTLEAGSFDMVYLDVYGKDALPECLYQPGFYQQLLHALSQQGMVAVNFVTADESDALGLMRLMYEAFHQQIICLSVGGYMNLVVLGFASDPFTDSSAALELSLQQLAARFELDFALLLENMLLNNPHMAEKIRLRFSR